MSTDDLTSPLRRVGSGGPASRFRLPVRIVLILLTIVTLAGVFGWLMKNRNPLGGEPRAVVPIKSLSQKQADIKDTDIRTSAEENAQSAPPETSSQHDAPNEQPTQNTETPPDKLMISGGKNVDARPRNRPLPKAPIEGLF